MLWTSLSIDTQNVKQEARKKKEPAGVLAEIIVVIVDADNFRMERPVMEGPRNKLTLRHASGMC